MFNQDTSLQFRFLLHIYRVFVFILISTFIFSPFVELAYKYLPESVAEQVTKIIPKVETASAHTDDVFVFITVASASALNLTWTVPDDWNSASNSIEVIGGGGGGGKDAGSGPGGGGGGGYSRINNLSLTAGATVHFNVGASGSAATADPGDGFAGSHSYFNAANFADCTDNTVCVKAEGGQGGKGNGAVTGGLGGSIATTANAVGTTVYAGGDGGLGCAGDGSGGGGGGGGPGGDGTGNIGGAGGGDSTPGVGGGGGGGGGGSDGLQGSVACGTAGGAQTGGDGGNNYLGSGGATDSSAANPGTSGGGGVGGNDGIAGGAGGAGDDWVTGWGSGGGGGGGGDGFAGANGGLYGGGGGGGEINGGRGADGIIVVKYNPLAVQTHFRWYNEGGTLDSPTSAISAEDIKASGSEALSISTTYRLRLQIANIDNYGSNANFTSDKFRLEMARAGTSCTSLSSGWEWKTVPLAATLASHAFDIEATANFVNGASTSASILTAPAGAATFTNGYGMDTRATTSLQTINDNQYTEIEWALKPSTDANTAASYCFRAGWITDASTTPDTRASMSFSKIASASVQAASVPVTFTQNDYEWFNNDSTSVQPGSSLTNGSENTSAKITKGDLPRLRMNVTIGGANLSASSQQFDLQYASNSNGPWAEVGTAQAKWAFANNTPADGDDIITVLVGSSEQGSRQTYEENNPSVLNPRAATLGDDIEYDWALDSASIELGITYYFRMVKADDTVFTAYNDYPEIRTDAQHSQSGGGGASSPPGDSGSSGGGQAQSGGGLGGGDGAASSPPGDSGESGGGQAQSGGNSGGGGGASPVMSDWWLWLLQLIL